MADFHSMIKAKYKPLFVVNINASRFVYCLQNLYQQTMLVPNININQMNG